MSATLVTPKTASGGEIIRELINSSDGQGLHFDGAAGYIDIASPPDLGTKFSFEFVVKADSIKSSGWNYILDFGNGGRLALASINGDLGFYDTGTRTFGVSVLDDLKVHHLVITVDGTAAVLYDNGNQVGTTTLGANATIDACSDATIGEGTDLAGNKFDGSIYRCRFYNKTLTQAEVDSAYQRADVDFADQYGSETSKLLNGTAWTGASGTTAPNSWTTGNQGTYTIDSSSGSGSEPALKIARSIDNPYIHQNFTAVIGAKYRISYKVKNIDATQANIGIGSSAIGSQYYLLGYSSTDWQTVNLEITATTNLISVYLQAITSTGTQAVYFDSVEIKQIGAVTDYDLAFANPTQSLMVQDRAGVADGTSSATGVSQTQKIPQLNATAIAAGAGPVTPADNTIHLKAADGAYGIIHENASGVKVATYTGGSSAFIGTQGAHQMSIATAGSERLTVSSAGDVSINASGADQKRNLNIHGTNGSSEQQTFTIESDGENALANFKLGIGGGAASTKMSISSAGLVTSTLSSADTNTAGVALKLDHATSGSSAVGFGTLIRFDGERTGSTSDGMGTMGFVADSMSASRVDGAFVVNTGQDGSYTERLRISSAGLVGINESDPGRQLTVVQSTTPTDFSDPILWVGGNGGADSYAANNKHAIGFHYVSSGDRKPGAAIGYTVTSNTGSTKGDLLFATRDVTTDTAPTTRMTISSAGDVSIGSTSSASGGQLHVDDALGAIIGLSRTTGAATQNLGQIRFGNTNVDSNLASIAAVQDGGSDNSRLEFRTQASGSEAATRLTIDKAGLATFANGIAFSQTNTSATGASATSTTLNHFESGTWTPVFKGGSSAGSYSAGTTVARYTRIGNVVSVLCSLINITESSAGSGSIEVSGLPFTSANISTQANGTGSVRLRSYTSSGSSVMAYVPDNSASVLFSQYVSGSADSHVSITGLSSGSSDLTFTLTYFV